MDCLYHREGRNSLVDAQCTNWSALLPEDKAMAAIIDLHSCETASNSGGAYSVLTNMKVPVRSDRAANMEGR